MTQISELLDEMRAMRAAVERIEKLLALAAAPPMTAAGVEAGQLVPGPIGYVSDPNRGGAPPLGINPSDPCLLHCREWCEQCWEPYFRQDEFVQRRRSGPPL